MKVIFSRSAEADLEGIGDFIARDNPKRAQSFVGEIRNHCMNLSAHPKSAPLFAGEEASGIRRLVHGNYVAFYRADLKTVQILRILHGARDAESLLFPDDNDPFET
ncbi:MAG: type II toxin-antitoxin system RelE/ParE family toxin [Rhizobiaceae bacterium]|nr:type II toxin-antitoxin system RelE/ParE family toxin [Rhizobiaceae bacterium]